MRRFVQFFVLFLSLATIGAEISVDFSVPAGKINPKLHGCNDLPTVFDEGNSSFAKMNFSFSRTHDTSLVNAGQRVVDTYFVFPQESADPTDPDNYYFKATDYLFRILASKGGVPYYRLGASIEHTRKHFNVVPPKDNLHYAKILAGIIRHYNYAWANGFKLNIPYWEIWGEPNMHQLWSGTKAQFIQFFVTVLKELKREFPHEKIGGPGLSWPDPEWIKPLLAACKEAGVKPDFISYHTYGSDPVGPDRVIRETRAMLDEAGFPDVELHLNEWHYTGFKKWADLSRELTNEEYQELMYSHRGMWGIDSAAYNVAMFCMFHDVPLDVSCYYGCGFGVWGFKTNERQLNRNFYSMKMIGELVKGYPRRVKGVVTRGETAAAPTDKGISFDDSAQPAKPENNYRYLLAATDTSGQKGAILLVDYRGKSNSIAVEIRGATPKNWEITRLDQLDHERKVPANFQNGVLTLEKSEPGSAVWLIQFDL